MSQDYADDELNISTREKNRAVEDMFKRSADELKHADYDKQVKLFGLFEVDAGLAAYITSMYNIGSDYLSHIFGPHVYALTHKLGGKAGLQGSTLAKTATVATVAVDVALKSGGFIGPIFHDWKEQRKELHEFARRIAPVLDEKVGNHSVHALKIAAKDNEMIRVQLRRMAKTAGVTNMNNFIDLGLNAGPNLLLNAKQAHFMWSRDAKPSEFKAHQRAQAESAEAKADNADFGDASNLKHLLGSAVNFSSAQFSDRIKKSNEHKLKKALKSYSAMEMVETLQQQVEHNPGARSFQTPGRSGESFGLEEYVMRVMIQHQRDMADISADHTEIREALNEDLAAAAKPIADAISKGEISALELIRLVGEGQVIKGHGRAIASPEEVQSYLARGIEKPVSQVHADPKEWYKGASFTPAQMKQALGSLDGEERENFAALFPDSILEQAGMSAKDVKAVRVSMAKRYEPLLAELLLGLTKHSDEDLKKEGLASNEIKQLRDAARQFEEGGVEALHALRASPTNDHGIERPLTNWAVSDIQYVGRVMSEGKALAAETAEKPRTSHGKNHRPRGENDNYPDAENDNEMSHLERARAGRGHANFERE